MRKTLYTKSITPSGVPGLSVTVKQNRAWEDFVAVASIGDNMYYAVFDGHGCRRDASLSQVKKHVCGYLSNYLHHHLADSLNGVNLDSLEEVKRAITNMFVDVDKRMYAGGGTYGSTCTIVFVTKNYVYQINAGDSKSVLFDRDGRVISETVPHDPSSKEERRRIESCGGFLCSENRVDGILATSRGFGDYSLKVDRKKYEGPTKVSCIPDVKCTPRKDAHVAVIGSDGLFFPGITNEDILRILRRSTIKNSSANLVAYAKEDDRNYSDDTSVIVVSI